MRTRNGGPTAAALRGAGFVPLPRLWVRADELEVILKIALKHKPQVDRIRGKIWGENEAKYGSGNNVPDWNPEEWNPR